MRIKREDRLLSDIIVALCADYDRRKQVIKEKSAGKRVRMEYVYLNSRLLVAAAEIAGAPYAEDFIRDIGERVGFAKTSLEVFSEVTYKRYKAEIKDNMLRRLNFKD